MYAAETNGDLTKKAVEVGISDEVAQKVNALRFLSVVLCFIKSDCQKIINEFRILKKIKVLDMRKINRSLGEF